MLYLTSCLFGTVVLHAHYQANHVIHFLFLLLTMLSVLFHSMHCFDAKRVVPVLFKNIHVLDRTLARFLVVYVSYKFYFIIGCYALLGSLSIILLWIALLSEKDELRGVRLHALLHIIAVLYSHSLLLC